jgi:galactokinase
VPALRDATLAMVEAGPLDPELRRRARHVVAENDRTVAAAEFLASGDVAAVGRLMDESHASLRDDFEVSSATLDAITDIARSHDGCFGARLTGGGFAGCAVALVATEALDGFIGTVGPAYDAATGETSVLYPTQPASGVGVV